MYPNLEQNNNDNIITESPDEDTKLNEEPNTRGEESNTSVIPSTLGHKVEYTSCCLKIKDFITRYKVLDWYLAPITYDLGFSISCLIYFWVNFGFALGMFILMVTGISTFTPLIILACVGLPLLYFLAEIIILLTRFNFYFTYYLVETDRLLLTNEKWKLKLTLDNKNLPLCNTLCMSGNRLNRVKFIFTSLNFYVIIIYHLFINPILILTLGLSTLPVLGLLYYVSFILRYPFNYSWFHNNRECWGSENCDGKMPCTCHGFAINNFGKVFLIFLCALILLPFAFHLCNYFAKLSKIVCYYILTDYYKYENSEEYNPNKSLLYLNGSGKNYGDNNNNKNVETNENIEITDGVKYDVPRHNGLINDHGVKDNENSPYDNL